MRSWSAVDAVLPAGDPGRVHRQGVDPRGSSLRIAILGAEPWTEEMRGEVEQRAGLDAVDIYGQSEVIGPGVAQECVESKDGPHIWEDHFYPEIIDPVSAEPVPDGELGELVFTSEPPGPPGLDRSTPRRLPATPVLILEIATSVVGPAGRL